MYEFMNSIMYHTTTVTMYMYAEYNCGHVEKLKDPHAGLIRGMVESF